MRFSIAAVLAFATTGLCQVAGFNVITNPEKGEQVPAGSTYQIVWQPSADQPGDITIGLMGGASPSTLDIIETIATGVDSSAGSYSWEVSAKLGDLATYGIKITLESDKDTFQYGFPFQIVGGGDDSDDEEVSTTTAAATTTATATDDDDKTTKTKTKTATATEDDSTSVTVPTSTIISSTISGNLSTTGSPQTTITSIVTEQPSSTTTASTTLVTANAAGVVAAGSFAMLGGVAMAVLAL
jgi:hypothetical protein